MQQALDAAFEVATMELEQSEEVQSPRLGRTMAQHLVIAGLRIREPTCAMSDHRVSKHIANRMPFSQPHFPLCS